MIVGTVSIASWKMSPILCRAVSVCDSCRSAPEVWAAPRSASSSLAFWNATAACEASTSSRRWSSSSNLPYPRLDSTITPTTSSPTIMGTASIDSSIVSVPAIWTANGTSRASGVSSDSRVAATVPVMPSPICGDQLLEVSFAYSVNSSPRNATGIRVSPSVATGRRGSCGSR